MRLVFFGTPEFAVPTLERLADAPGHEVVAVVSQPDRPRGRGRAVHPSPVSAFALERGLPLWRPERVGEPTVADALRERAPELGERLARIAADAIVDALAAIADGSVRWQPQDDARATLAPKLGPDDRRLDFREPAAALARRVRALAPTPGAQAALDGETIRILAARAEPGVPDRAPGGVRARAGEPLRIATGDGWLVPRRLQRAGAKPLDVDAYLRGRPIPDGARFDELP